MGSIGRSHHFWQLASMTGIALGLPGMAVGGQLAQTLGAGSAFISVLIGNFLLWIIGLAIISMAGNRNHAVENVKEYLGRGSSIVVALILMLAFLIWYALQIKAATYAMSYLFHLEEKRWILGTLFGLVIAVLGIGGIRLIARLCVIALPLLLVFAIYAIISLDKTAPFQESASWGISFDGILQVLLVWLPFGVNLPTFFRSSRSKADSILGLTLMTGFHTFFQTYTIFVPIEHPSQIFSIYEGGHVFFYAGLAALFVLLAFVSVNLLNIYFASAAWETIFPKHQSSKEYLFIGVLGTLMYLFLQLHQVGRIADLMVFFEILLESFIASLAVVLLTAFLVKIVVMHRPRFCERFYNTICWTVGCFVSLHYEWTAPNQLKEAVLAGMIASVLSFLTLIFFEEAVWSIKRLQERKEL